MLTKEIIIWDKNGTIIGAKDPNEKHDSKVILPNVHHVMTTSKAVHVICSGCKTPSSEQQNFDPENIIKRFTTLMAQLPIQAATFSPAIGGTECWVIIKKLSGAEIIIRKAHEESRYQHLIGSFKKPETGMLTVIRDLLQEEFNITMESENALFIGDSWQDEHAATGAGIPFLDAAQLHAMKFENLSRL